MRIACPCSKRIVTLTCRLWDELILDNRHTRRAVCYCLLSGAALRQRRLRLEIDVRGCCTQYRARFKSARVSSCSVNVLTIAGSDPSSEAGVQGDLRTFADLGHRGFSVVTAVTSQNLSQFTGAEPVTAELVKSQIDAVLDCFEIDAVKVGMVYSSAVITAVHSGLKGSKVPIVLDPVAESTTGGVLLRREALPSYRRLLIPLARAVTPNVAEAQLLIGSRIASRKDMVRAAQRLTLMGAECVVVTGLDTGDRISDCVYAGSKASFASSAKLAATVHGSGCSYSAALTAFLAAGADIHSAAKSARRYAIELIRRAGAVSGNPVAKSSASAEVIERLQEAVRRLVQIRGIHNLIPEVQMNFGYARVNPRSSMDVAAVQGRIVRSGRRAVVAGPITFGSSRHVAAAILQMCAKFPATRSALNIKYSAETAKGLYQRGMTVLSYDRRAEPARGVEIEGRTVRWGIRRALADAESPPDAIYHEGGWGKEPMILLFGRDPDDVVRKVESAQSLH